MDIALLTSVLTKPLLLWFEMAFFHFLFILGSCLGLCGLPFMKAGSNPLVCHFHLLLPSLERSSPPGSVLGCVASRDWADLPCRPLRAPSIPEATKNHQESWWAGNWDRNFFFFGWTVLAKPMSWPYWWQERMLVQERKWGWAGIFGEESGWILRNLGWLLHVAAS